MQGKRILYLVVGIMWGMVFSYKFELTRNPLVFAIIVTLIALITDIFLTSDEYE